MSAIEDFFRDLDARWEVRSTGTVPLRIIGSTALMLQVSYARSTTDSDVLESSAMGAETRSTLLRLAGAGTELHRRHRLYVQLINEAIPFLPQVPNWRTVAGLDDLVNLELRILDVVDVVVSKLSRFNAKDISDISAMIDLGAVPHEALVDRFRRAVDYISSDARAENLPRYCANLNRVERDFLAVAETDLDLPSWI